MTYDGLRDAVIHSNNMNMEMKEALFKMINEAELWENARPKYQKVKEGDLLKINASIYAVAAIFTLDDYLDFGMGSPGKMAVLYDFYKRKLGFAFESLYSDPDSCEITGHINPKQIFREDVKI